ncbi:MAG: YggS family pyridoxal phosphate-dependent enzyme [bacterium]|jgi:pyridoxal phosphate enzyme (YggS family)|nr:YggS family pyridoxal phosphate-dependent enzyme [bacterium]MDD3804725.1 YggS family pyridoxal phosphate-dependent enzyme [bacterium]MDD4152191.1 YggS family pyridoxal phosphate-dependent enzyme [bacterium]MDD4558347.1 YggS family pyridoxal phosphate-dependent enzyme [bacterium]
MKRSIADNIAYIHENIAIAASTSGRSVDAVRLVAVTKTVEPERIIEALEAGITDIGENYVQEAEAKFEALKGYEFTRHMIGSLQSNKAGRAVGLFDWIQTVDSVKLANRLSQASLAAGKKVRVLIEVNIGGESSKAGMSPEKVSSNLENIAGAEGVEVVGLMAIPPVGDELSSRRYFAELRHIRDSLSRQTGLNLPELSMGMSHDYASAVKEGATIVRIGRAIFGDRR